MMTEKSFSLSDCNKCAIPVAIAIAVFMAYFVYLMHNGLVSNMTDFIILLALPLMILVPLVALVSFEFFDHQMTKRTMRFHLKRLGVSTLQLLTYVLPLIMLMLFAGSFLGPAIGKWSMILAYVLWVTILAAIILLRRKFTDSKS